MEQETDRLTVDPEDAANTLFTTVVDKLNAGAKFGGFFPNGIELIKIIVGVGKDNAILNVTVVVAGKDGVPGAGTLEAHPEKQNTKNVTVNICDEILEHHHLHVHDTLTWNNPSAEDCLITLPHPHPLDRDQYPVPHHGHATANVLGPAGAYSYHSSCCDLQADPRLVVT